MLLLFILPLIFRAVLDHTAVPETIIVIRGFIATFIFLVRRTEPSHLVPLIPAIDTPVCTAFHASHAAIVDAWNFAIFIINKLLFFHSHINEKLHLQPISTQSNAVINNNYIVFTRSRQIIFEY